MNEASAMTEASGLVKNQDGGLKDPVRRELEKANGSSTAREGRDRAAAEGDG
jgi:hypothetical protein